MAPNHCTFLLMLVDFQLPLLLQPQSIDNGHCESEGLFWITMGTQGINPSTGCRHMFYQKKIFWLSYLFKLGRFMLLKESLCPVQFLKFNLTSMVYQKLYFIF